jgi:hypothetical protein
MTGVDVLDQSAPDEPITALNAVDDEQGGGPAGDLTDGRGRRGAPRGAGG